MRACNITLQAVVTPPNGGQAAADAIPFCDFAVTQPCGTGITTVAAALASAPVSAIAFRAAGGGAALGAMTERGADGRRQA